MDKRLELTKLRSPTPYAIERIWNSFFVQALHPASIIGLVISILSQASFAQNDNESSVRKSAPVEIIGDKNFDDKADSISLKINITRDSLLKFGDSNLLSALSRQSGISVITNGGRNSEIRLRGLGEGYVLILINGDAAPSGFSLDNLTTEMVERVEIRRSPTAETGGQAIAGTINIVLRKDISVRDHQVKFAASHRLGGGGAFVTELIQGFKFEGFSSSIVTGLSSTKEEGEKGITDLFENPVGILSHRRSSTQRNIETIQSFNVRPTLKFELDPATNLNLEGLYRYSQLSDVVSETTDSFFGLPPLYANDNFKLSLRATTANVSLKFNRNFDSASAIDVNMGGSLINRNTIGKLTSTNVNNMLNRDRDIFSTTVDRSLTLGVRYKTTYTDKHSFVVGATSSTRSRSEQRDQREVPFPNIVPENIYEINKSSTETLALYAQDEWDLNKEASLYLGVRQEALTIRSDWMQQNSVRRNDSVTTPIVQLRWQPDSSKKHQLRFAFSRTFKAPQPNELSSRRYVSSENSPTSPDRTGNPALRPELATGLDVTYDFNLDKTTSSSLNIFIRKIRDPVNPNLDYVNGKWVTFPYNFSVAHTYGVEFDMKFPLRRISENFDGLEFRMNANRNWSRVTELPSPGNQLARQFPVVAGIQMDYFSKDKQFSSGVSYLYENRGIAWHSASVLDRQPTKRSIDLYITKRLGTSSLFKIVLSNAVKPPLVSGRDFIGAEGHYRQESIMKTYSTLKLSFDYKL